ncbi:MAG: ROK family protein [Filimonas sp.]|nr:ROK family protein [Filimonas sp.]
MKQQTHLCGVDIGGSHITAAFIERETRSVNTSSLRRANVDSGNTAAHILDAWTQVLLPFAESKPLHIGIAMPGPFDYEAGISQIKGQAKYDALYGLNIKEELARRLGISRDDISMSNDASCFLKGEVAGGSAQKYRHVVGVTLGTGLGSAVFHDDEAVDADLWCSPFKDGIAEEYLSTRWMVKRYAQLTGTSVPDVRSLTAYLPASPYAQQVFNEFGHNLGLFLASFVQQEQVEAIVIGGNIARAMVFFNEALQNALHQEGVDVAVHVSGLGEHAALVGAVYDTILV